MIALHSHNSMGTITWIPGEAGQAILAEQSPEVTTAITETVTALLAKFSSTLNAALHNPSPLLIQIIDDLDMGINEVNARAVIRLQA